MTATNPMLSKIQSLGTALAGETISQIDLALIDLDPEQPRKTIDPVELEELAENIKKTGLAQAIIVARANVPGRFYVVIGERRYRASKMAGKDKIPAVVRDMTQRQIDAVRLAENRFRQNISALEEATAIVKYINDHLGGLSHGVGKIAAADLGYKESKISKALALMNLPPEIMGAYQDGIISDAETAVDLGKVQQSDPAAAAAIVAKAKSGETVTRQEVREAVKKTKERKPKKEPAPSDANPGAGQRCPHTTDMLGGVNPPTENSDAEEKSQPHASRIGDNAATEKALVDGLAALLDAAADDLAATKRFAALVRQIRQRALALGLDWEDIITAANYDIKQQAGGEAHGGEA